MREEQIQEAPVKVLLVGVDVGEEPDFERSMEELASLAEAAKRSGRSDGTTAGSCQ